MYVPTLADAVSKWCVGNGDLHPRNFGNHANNFFNVMVSKGPIWREVYGRIEKGEWVVSNKCEWRESGWKQRRVIKSLQDFVDYINSLAPTKEEVVSWMEDRSGIFRDDGMFYYHDADDDFEPMLKCPLFSSMIHGAYKKEVYRPIRLKVIKDRIPA